MNIPMLHESRGSLILFFDGKIGGILQQRHLSMLESGYEATETDGETAGIVGKCFAATTAIAAARQSLIGIMMLHCAGENVAATTATATATKFAQLHEV
jgi:hypothetical protein